MAKVKLFFKKVCVVSWIFVHNLLLQEGHDEIYLMVIPLYCEPGQIYVIQDEVTIPPVAIGANNGLLVS